MTPHDKPEDCPTPRECPVERRDFIERLKTIEDEAAASKTSRRELEHSVSELTRRVDRLLTLMEGNFGRPGMVVQQDSIEHRVHTLENWKTQQRAFIAGVAAVGSIVGGVIVAAGQAIWHYLR